MDELGPLVGIDWLELPRWPTANCSRPRRPRSVSSPGVDDPRRRQLSWFTCAAKRWGSPLECMDYYSDDYPETPLEEFLAVYERLTKYAKREIHDLALSLATGGCVADESSPIQPH